MENDKASGQESADSVDDANDIEKDVLGKDCGVVNDGSEMAFPVASDSKTGLQVARGSE